MERWKWGGDSIGITGKLFGDGNKEKKQTFTVFFKKGEENHFIISLALL